LLVAAYDLDIAYFPTTAIHARAAVNIALES
jgi:aspartate/glutamate racemase